MYLKGGEGTVIDKDITSVTVSCTARNQWAWMSGSSTINTSAIYGTMGADASNNMPGGTDGAANWVDSVGNIWMMGGFGIDGSGQYGRKNELWKYSINDNKWTLLSGGNTTVPVYGTKGVEDAANIPGAREKP